MFRAARNFIFRNPARNSTIIIAYCVNNLQYIGYFLLNKKIDELTSKKWHHWESNQSHLFHSCMPITTRPRRDWLPMIDFKSDLKPHGIKQISCVYRIITLYYNAISYYWFNELRPKDDAVIPRWVTIKKITRAAHKQMGSSYSDFNQYLRID